MTTLLRKYLDYLPLENGSNIDSLGEGNTPLVKSSYVGKGVGIPHLFFKSEHMNPTGSFKDRFAAVEVALMRQGGVKSCIATSSGNTGAALAAYSARHGIKCHIFINEIAPANKLTQMLVYGAKLFRVKGFGVSEEKSRFVFQRLQDLSEECGSRLVVSAYEYSPAGMEGVKTIAYELVEQLKGVP
ncbi:MAG: threonine synthase, partial [Chloroflexota bacterium]